MYDWKVQNIPIFDRKVSNTNRLLSDNTVILSPI